MRHTLFIYLPLLSVLFGYAIGRIHEANRWVRNAHTYIRIEHQGKLYKVTEA